ncbi:hypothetical protein [Streptomyces sp. NPDC046332]|uniref:hypothetical protein n=1 Tax=Streptomyces sp. NPDC046332 TaxID=3155133 RepID=UPI0033D1AF69
MDPGEPDAQEAVEAGPFQAGEGVCGRGQGAKDCSAAAGRGEYGQQRESADDGAEEL